MRIGIVYLAWLAVSLAFLAPAIAQGPTDGVDPAETGVPAKDDPRRPQPPPGTDGKSVGWVIGRPFAWIFSPLDNGLRAGGAYLESNCGGVAGGFSNAGALQGCFPKYWTPRINFGGRPGLIGGITVHTNRYRSRGLQARAGAYGSTKGYWGVDGEFGWNDPLQHPYLRVFGATIDLAREEYWGPGSESSELTKTNYSVRNSGVTFQAGIPFRNNWNRISGDVNLAYFQAEIGQGGGTLPPTDEVFDPIEAPGVNAGQIQWWAPGGYLVLDLTDSPGYPTKGIRLRGNARRFDNVNDKPFAWTRYGGEVQAHVPLGTEWNIFTFQTGFQHADPADKNVVPFYQFPFLGGANTLRGYPTARFRGPAATYANFEYRFSIWRAERFKPTDPRSGVETVIYYQLGDVAPSMGDIDFANLDSFGFEFRAYFAETMAIRLGLAWADEGMRFQFATIDPFNFRDIF